MPRAFRTGRAAAVVATILLLISAATWLVLEQVPAAPVGVGQVAPVSGSGRALDAEVDPREAGAVRQAGGAREAVAATDDEAPSRSATVRVVTRGDGVPVSGAEVLYRRRAVDPGAMSDEDRRAHELHGHDQERLLERFGTVTRTDAGGRAHLRLQQDRTTVVARHDGRYGELSLNLREVTPPDGWVVELEPDLVARLRVVDAVGRPAGDVPVGLAVRRQRPTEAEPRPDWLGFGRTDATTGIAELRHLQQHARTVAPDSDGRRTATPGVRLPALVEDGPTFDLLAPPVEPLEIALPATGRLVVTVTEPDGDPVDSAWVYLQPRDDAPGGRWGGSERTVDGRAVFDHVGLGLGLFVSAWVRQNQRRIECDGPVAPDQEVVVPLTIGDERAEIVGRVLGATRELLCEQRFRLRITSGGGSNAQDFTTDASGRVRVALNRWVLGSRVGRAWIEHLDEHGGALAEATDLTLRDELEPREYDVGDVLLAEPPLIVGGRLLGGDDETLRRARLDVEYAVQREQPGDRGEVQWRRGGFASTVLGVDGAFELRGQPPAAPLRLAVRLPGHRPVAPVEFALGTRDLEIAVDAGCEAMVLVTLDAEIPHDPLAVRLEPTGAGADARSDRTGGELAGRRDGRLTYRWRGVAPGSYRLCVTLRGHAEPLAVVGGIVLEPTADDGGQRLPDVDLCGRLRRIEVRLADATGGPIRGEAGVAVFLRSGAGAELDAVAAGARFSILVAAPAVDLLVAVPGYRVEQVRGLQADTTVTLDPAARVRLRLSPDAPQPPEGVRVTATLTALAPAAVADERRYRMLWWSRGSVADLVRGSLSRQLRDGTATFAVRDPGRYTVAVTAASKGSTLPVAVEPSEIAIRDVDAEQGFVLTVPADAFATLAADQPQAPLTGR